MAAAIPWPASVNTRVMTGTYAEEPERFVSQFTPEIGPPLEAVDSLVSIDLLSFEQSLTADEWQDLMHFWRVTLRQGVLPFLRIDPMTGTGEQVFRFAAAPSLRHVMAGVHRASISLRRFG